MHVELSFLSFFETPTVSKMAQRVEAHARLAPELHLPPVQPISRSRPLPLSYAQQRLWFLEQMGLTRRAYLLLDAMHVHGRLDREALTQSLQEMIRRHETLRTTFMDIEGEPYQLVGSAHAVPLTSIDLRPLPAASRELQTHAIVKGETQRCFDLTTGPLLRVTLVQLAAEAHVLLLCMHHMVSDSWSRGVFWQELTRLYAAFTSGEPSPLPPLAIQYADFAAWQQQWLQGDVLLPALTYWQRQLADLTRLQLPADRPRPAIKTFQGARHAMRLSSPLTQGLKELSLRHGATLFMTLLAAFQALLHRYSGQDDIAVGSLIANRQQTVTEGLIGFFVNTIALRTDCSGDPSFQTLLARVRETTLNAYSHQNLPFEKLLEALRPTRDLSYTPLFQVLFVLHNTIGARPALTGLDIYPFEVDTETARFDLALELTETPAGLQGWLEYSTDLFDAATIARMAGHLQTLLEGGMAEPTQHLSRLPLLRADERRQLLLAGHANHLNAPQDLCIHEAFEAQVLQTPHAIAVMHGDEHLSYQALNRRANQVAHALRALGVGMETLVGLCMERSLHMMVGLLGILKAGAAYLPLDPSYPQDRLDFMMQDAQVSVVLTQEHLTSHVSRDGIAVICLDSEWPAMARYRDDNPTCKTTPDQAAYLLYTSGSTGAPKGVVGLHRATMNALAWMSQTYPLTPHDVCCQKTSISFGDSIQELFGPLLQGVRTVLISEATVKDLPRFVDTLSLNGVTRLILVQPGGNNIPIRGPFSASHEIRAPLSNW